MAIPDPPKAGSPFSPLWTGGWNPKTPKINNFFIPEITLRGGYRLATAAYKVNIKVKVLIVPVPAHAPGWGGGTDVTSVAVN